MSLGMRWTSPALSLATWLGMLAVVSALPAGAQETPLAKAQAAARAVTRVLWWNDPALVKDLALSEAQRAEMDAAYARYDKVLREAPERGKLVTDVEAAVAAGDFAAARRRVDALAEETQAPVRALATLRVEVFELLSAEQRAEVLARLPRLLKMPWQPRPTWASPAPRAAQPPQP
jgi:Spy/CpxP family protein refolding chaperone